MLINNRLTTVIMGVLLIGTADYSAAQLTCETATLIEGEGVFAFDNRDAGDDGVGSCAIDNSVWYRWTSTCDGIISIDTCGATHLSTRIGVYEDQPCSADMEALSCESHYETLPLGTPYHTYCAAQSHEQVTVEAGKTYLIQVGEVPPSLGHELPGGMGYFTIQCGLLESPKCNHPDAFCREPDLFGLIPFTGNFTRIATQFTPESDGIVHTLCLWGAYGSPEGTDCSLGVQDQFVVTYYEDEGGLPGNVVGGPFSLLSGTLKLLNRARAGRTMFGGLHEYEFRLDHAFVPLSGQTCYWLEVANNQSSECRWRWETTNDNHSLEDVFPARSYLDVARSVQHFGSPGSASYELEDYLDENPAFCLDTAMSQQANCGAEPAGDVRETAVTIESGTHFVDLTNAQTEDESPVCELPLGDDGFYRDRWFSHTATCDGTLIIDVFDAQLDPRIAVYSVNVPGGDPTMPRACNDDDTSLRSDARVAVSVDAGEHMLIRVGDRKRNIDFSSDGQGEARIGGLATMSVTCMASGTADSCTDLEPQHLPHTFEGSNVSTTGGYPQIPGTQSWIAFSVSTPSTVRLDYTGSSDEFVYAFDRLATSCNAGAFTDPGIIEGLEEGQPVVTWPCIPPGTYYYPVVAHRLSEGQFVIDVTTAACGGVCATSANDCFLGGESPGCEDKACCEQVCLFDPACCSVSWDATCAAHASTLCAEDPFAVCGDGNPGDCCQAHEFGGCENEYICQRTCACDPYCCLVQWDELCLAELGSLNPACGSLRDLNVDGIYDIDTYCLDGPEPDLCKISCLGDHNCDGYVEWWDYGWMWDHCRVFHGTLCIASCLQSFDYDYSGDLNLADFAHFQNAFTGY